MEVRGQEREMGMGFDSSSAPSPSSPSSRKDQFVIDQTQTLDHHHPLYHQLNLRHKPRRESPDPVSAPLGSDLLEATPFIPSPPTTSTAAAPSIRYRECQKNHAAATGGHVVDGCGEFMPCGDQGTPESLKCAACECHRNFHRKEVDGQTQHAAARQNYTRRDAITITPSLPPPTAPAQPQTALQHRHRYHHHHHRFIAPMMMAFGGGAAESSSEDLNMYPNMNNDNIGGRGQGGHVQGLSRKRFRTKFSTEQKEKMTEFAEKIGWKIQKQDEEQVQQLCGQLGVKRQVFKVWMHNNKKKQ